MLPFRIGPKGRVVLPAAVRRAAHVEVGRDVVARPDGDGRFVIESVEAIRRRVWAAAPVPTGLDATEDVRALREDDNRVADENWARRGADAASSSPCPRRPRVQSRCR